MVQEIAAGPTPSRREGAGTIPGAVFEAARAFGHSVAIVEDAARFSFAQLGAETRSAAKAYLASGLRKGEVVGVWAPNTARWITAAAGAQAVGGVLIPLNTRLRGREVKRAADRAAIRILVCVGRFLGQDYPALLANVELPSVRQIIVLGDSGAHDERMLSWDAFLAGGEAISDEALDARMAEVTPDDLSDIMFTSGTTGEPKGAMFSHARSLGGARAWLSASPILRGSRYLAFGPFSHTAGYKAGWVATMLSGCTLYATSRTDPSSLLELISRERITIMPAPPTVLQTLLAHPEREAYDLSSLEFISTGSAVVPIELVRRLKSEVGVRQMATGYGLTEGCGTSTMTRPQDPLELVAATAGRAVRGVEIRCARPDGSVCAAGEPGEVLVRGGMLMLGYLDDPAATAAAIDRDGWLHTGDVGALDAQGNLKITDRLKDMYIVGGFNCYPAEIERDLAGLPGVMHCAVVGVPHERLGEVGRAFVVRAPGATLTADDVIAWCKANLANYKTPRSVVFLDALPMNATGKVLKQELRAMDPAR